MSPLRLESRFYLSSEPRVSLVCRVFVTLSPSRRSLALSRHTSSWQFSSCWYFLTCSRAILSTYFNRCLLLVFQYSSHSLQAYSGRYSFRLWISYCEWVLSLSCQLNYLLRFLYLLHFCSSFFMAVQGSIVSYLSDLLLNFANSQLIEERLYYFSLICECSCSFLNCRFSLSIIELLFIYCNFQISLLFISILAVISSILRVSYSTVASRLPLSLRVRSRSSISSLLTWLHFTISFFRSATATLLSPSAFLACPLRLVTIYLICSSSDLI